MTEPEKNPDDRAGSAGTGKSESHHDFGSPFDYDATAEASLSEPPATSEIGPVGGATGSGSGSGPGWDVHSGVGNGPGWGESPSYPPPSGTGQPGPVYGPPDPNYPQPGQYPSQDQTGPYGQPGPYGQSGQYPPPGQYGQPGYPQQGFPGLPVYAGYPGGPYGMDPAAPYGRHPVTGEPFSEKSKVTGGVLGILLGPFGAGRFYLNQPGMAVAQIAVTWLTCGIGAVWPVIDGIMMLTGNVRDQHGRPLRD